MPIIIQSAYAMQTTKEEAIESGCDDFITKPIKVETLLAILHRHLIY